MVDASSATPTASVKPAAATSRRNQTPPPRAAKPVEKEPPVQESEDDDEDAVSEEEPLPEYKGVTILGLHPQPFVAIVVAPVVFLILCVLAAGPGRASVVAVGNFTATKWSAVSTPVTTLFVKRADIIVATVAVGAMSPLLVLIAVSSFRAAVDLRHFAMWQKMLLGVLVLSALGTVGIFNKQAIRMAMMMKKGWDSISDPLETFLATNADNIVAGTSILCLLPLALAVASYAARALWGCRVKIVVEPVEGSSE
jgi:hypothetical protein